MKKNGFTLIELLAVIVILAIIALIATPIVLNIIANSKESATIRGAEYYLNAVELGIARERLDNIKVKDGEYIVQENGNICKEEECIIVEVSGEIPNVGSIVKIVNGKTTDISLKYGDKTVVKEENKLVFARDNNNNNNNNEDDNNDDNNDDTNTDNNIPDSVSFGADTWETIIANVKAGNLSKYNVGDTKEIELELDGQKKSFTVRIANTPSETDEEEKKCGTEGFSETACGFVIEFVDIIATHVMNPTKARIIVASGGVNTGGWPASDMYEYVNETIYNALDPVVKNAIIPTIVVSGHGSTSGETNFETDDKLYLLSTQEVWGSNLSNDTANAETRQLDYYKDIAKVTASNYSGAKKYLSSGTANAWWLRSAAQSDDSSFYFINTDGAPGYFESIEPYGVAPAFRLG